MAKTTDKKNVGKKATSPTKKAKLTGAATKAIGALKSSKQTQTKAKPKSPRVAATPAAPTPEIQSGLSLTDRLNAIRDAKAQYDWPLVEANLEAYKQDFEEDRIYLTYTSDLAFSKREFEAAIVYNQRIVEESETHYWDLKKLELENLTEKDFKEAHLDSQYWAHYRLGDANYELGNIQGALEAFTTAKNLRPKSSHANERIARIMVAKGELFEAISELQVSLSENPGHVFSVVSLTEIYNSKGRYKEALKAINESLAVPGNETDATLLGLRAEVQRNADFEYHVTENWDELKRILGDTTINDIGAADGLFWKWTILARAGIVKGVGFEPDEYEVGKLNTLFPFVNFIPNAIGGRKGKTAFHIAENMPCSSLRAPDMDVLGRFPIRSCFATKRKFEIEVDTLENSLKSHGIKKIDFLKVDVQGAENEILKGAGDMLDDVLAIELETHILPLYHGESVLWELIDMLAKRGFRVRGLAPQGSFEGEVVEIEAFFAKDLSTLSDVEVQRVFLWEAISDCPQLPFMADDKGLPAYPHLAKTVSQRDKDLADLRVTTRALLGL